MELLEEQVYLYSMHKGKVTLHIGRLYQSMHGNCIFKNDTRERYTCASEPGVVYNNTVYFMKKNNKKAIKLFIEHEENEIAKVQEKIDKRLFKIAALRSNEIE